MAVIDVSREALMVLIERIQTEHGITVVSNFALDLQLNRAEALIKALQENSANLNREKAEMQEVINQIRSDNEALKCQLDASRAERRKGVVRREEKTDGAN